MTVAVSVSFGEAIRRLEDLDRRIIMRAAKRAFYRALDAGRRAAEQALLRSRIGKNVQRRGERQLELAFRTSGHYTMGQLEAIRGSHIPLVITRSEMKEASRGTVLRSGLETQGFAALIESGGRTKSHQLKPIRLEGYSKRRSQRFGQLLTGGYMTFQIGGRWVSKRVITHPGSRVPRSPFLRQGAAVAERELVTQWERAIAEDASKAGL